MEAGQILHNNPVGYDASDFVEALIFSIRREIERVYWNVHQTPFYDSSAQKWGSSTGLPPLGIPGMEWWPYYNWSGCPEDDDWDQQAADKPNFSFEGVHVRWYKHFGRSMNVNVIWPAEKWERWFERCRQTLRAFESEREQVRHGDPVPYPDPSTAVSLDPEPADLRYVAMLEQIKTLEAQINCIACVCIDVENNEQPQFVPDDWRWCHTLDWVTRLGRHALLAPSKFELHDSSTSGEHGLKFR